VALRELDPYVKRLSDADYRRFVEERLLARNAKPHPDCIMCSGTGTRLTFKHPMSWEIKKLACECRPEWRDAKRAVSSSVR
jgi:hypothetical protein